jgi:hypothetical protein
MRGRDKSDVVTAAFLQLKHHLGQAFVGDLVLFLLTPGLRDLIILAIYAAEIAVAEKYIAGTFCSRQTRFLAKMRGIARDYRQTARVARGYFILLAVITAILWTDVAGGEQGLELFNP